MLKGITAYELLDLFVSYNDVMLNTPEAFVFIRLIGTWVFKLL